MSLGAMAGSDSRESPPEGGPAIYHLADVRLGGAFPFLGDAGAGHRAQVRETFARAVEQGLSLSPSLVLITGNLFGTQFPSRDLAEFARAQIERFAGRGIAVLVAAGPLDAAFERSYAAEALADIERVSVFPEAPKVIELRDLDLTVVGASWGAAPVHAEVLAAVGANRTQRHLVGAFHLQLPETEEGLRALRRQIAASGATYLALGGSPVRRDLSSEGVAAWCPGAPDLVAPAEGEGSPLLVRLGEEVEARPVPVARRRFVRVVLEPAAFASTEDLAAAVRALADPHHAAAVHLRGASRINQFADTGELQSRLAREFLALEIADESLPSEADLEAAAYPELSVAGKLVAIARTEIARTEMARTEIARAESLEARARAGAALRLGLSLLEGRRPP